MKKLIHFLGPPTRGTKFTWAPAGPAGWLRAGLAPAGPAGWVGPARPGPARVLYINGVLGPGALGQFLYEIPVPGDPNLHLAVFLYT